MNSNLASLLDSSDPELFRVQTTSAGPVGRLPITESMLLDAPSGDLFGLTQNAGMV